MFLTVSSSRQNQLGRPLTEYSSAMNFAFFINFAPTGATTSAGAFVHEPTKRKKKKGDDKEKRVGCYLNSEARKLALSSQDMSRTALYCCTAEDQTHVGPSLSVCLSSRFCLDPHLP